MHCMVTPTYTYAQVNTDNPFLSRNDDEDIKRRSEERYALKL